MMPSSDILEEYSQLKKVFPHTAIIFNANTDKFFVSVIPLSWTNSLFLKKVDMPEETVKLNITEKEAPKKCFIYKLVKLF